MELDDGVLVMNLLEYCNFCVGNSSSRHSENHKNILLMFGEEPIDYIKDSVGVPEEKLSISFTKAKATFCLSLNHNGDERYLDMNETEICELKVLTI